MDAAHAQGIYVIFDIVLTNHTGDVFAYPCGPADTLCQQTSGAEAAFRSLPSRSAGATPAGRRTRP